METTNNNNTEKKNCVLIKNPESKNLISTLSEMLSGKEGYNSGKIKELIQGFVCSLRKTYNFKKIPYTKEHIEKQFYSNSLKGKYAVFIILQSIDRIEAKITQIEDLHSQKMVLYFLVNYFTDIMIDLNHISINGKAIDFSIYRGANSVSSVHNFQASQDLLYNNINIGHPSIQTINQTSVFLLRQAIELRLTRCIGIETITKNHLPLKIKLESILDFIIRNKEIEWQFKIEKSVLMKVIKWTNDFVHTGLINSLWMIEWAQFITQNMFANSGDEKKEMLKKFMNGDKSVFKPGKVQWSIYDSIQMKKDYYENSLENDLKSFIVKLKNKNDITEDSLNIVLMKRPECLLKE